MAAVDVGFDRAAIAGFEAVRFGAGIDDLDAELVTQNARVVEERLFAGEGVEVGAADADAVNAHEGFAGSGRRFGSVVGGGEVAGFFEGDLEHEANEIRSGSQRTPSAGHGEHRVSQLGGVQRMAVRVYRYA
jgi:hypothetical protein